MNTQQLSNQFHLGGKLFWGKIFGKREFPKPESSTGR